MRSQDISTLQPWFLPAKATYDRLINRLDADKLEQLQRWGAGLAGVEDEELRATGKAILLLIEEIEGLHVELWNAKAVAAVPAEETERDGVEETDGTLDGTLGARLRRLRRRSASERA